MKPTIKQMPKFKMVAYDNKGALKKDISYEDFKSVIREYGDVMRAVSQNKWVTLDEVCEDVWRFEKKLKNQSPRTRKQIEDGLWKMLDTKVIIQS